MWRTGFSLVFSSVNRCILSVISDFDLFDVCMYRVLKVKSLFVLLAGRRKLLQQHPPPIYRGPSSRTGQPTHTQIHTRLGNSNVQRRAAGTEVTKSCMSTRSVLRVHRGKGTETLNICWNVINISVLNNIIILQAYIWELTFFFHKPDVIPFLQWRCFSFALLRPNLTQPNLLHNTLR